MTLSEDAHWAQKMKKRSALRADVSDRRPLPIAEAAGAKAKPCRSRTKEEKSPKEVKGAKKTANLAECRQ